MATQTDKLTIRLTDPHAVMVETKGGSAVFEVDTLTRTTRLTGRLFLNGAEFSGGGAPTAADYLVGTAQGGLSAEIVVGLTPGGELGGTWDMPTVDATHSGSASTLVSWPSSRHLRQNMVNSKQR